LPHELVVGNGLQVPSPAIWPKDTLAYVEWYQQLQPNPDKNHGMFSVRKPSSMQCDIIPITNIRQTCMLIPNFGKDSPSKDWRSDTVLDVAPSFLLNNWQSLYAYQSLW
jgi:hypothetical protein